MRFVKIKTKQTLVNKIQYSAILFNIYEGNATQSATKEHLGYFRFSLLNIYVVGRTVYDTRKSPIVTLYEPSVWLFIYYHPAPSYMEFYEHTTYLSAR